MNPIRRCSRFAWPHARQNRRCRSVSTICTCRWCSNVSSLHLYCWRDPLTGVLRWVSLATRAALKVCGMPAKAASCEASTSRTRRIETTAAAVLQLPPIRRPSCNSCARFTPLHSSPALGSPIDPVRAVAWRNRHPSHTTVETIYAVLIEHFCKGIIYHRCVLFRILKMQFNPNKLLALKFLWNFVWILNQLPVSFVSKSYTF